MKFNIAIAIIRYIAIIKQYKKRMTSLYYFYIILYIYPHIICNVKHLHLLFIAFRNVKEKMFTYDLLFYSDIANLKGMSNRITNFFFICYSFCLRRLSLQYMKLQ